MTFDGHRLTRIWVLDFGLFEVGPPGGPVRRRIGIPGFLLETDRRARILVDTGFDSLYATDPAAAEARDGLSAFGRLVGFTTRQTVEGQLALLGLAPADIDALVLTHSHIDHAGGLDLFAGRPIWLTASEHALHRPMWFGGRHPLAWPSADYRPIGADTALADGIALIPTPGHTPGHLSLALALADGRRVILAADALNRASEPDEGYADAMDPAAAATSGTALLARAAREGATLIYGHEPAQWPLLPKAPLPW